MAVVVRVEHEVAAQLDPDVVDGELEQRPEEPLVEHERDRLGAIDARDDRGLGDEVAGDVRLDREHIANHRAAAREAEPLPLFPLIEGRHIDLEDVHRVDSVEEHLAGERDDDADRDVELRVPENVAQLLHGIPWLCTQLIAVI